MNDPLSSNDIITDNHILRSLPGVEATALAPNLKWTDMPHGDVVYEPDDKITHVYFPSNSMISIVAVTADGHSAECGLAGWEGIGGVEALLGAPLSTNRCIVQIAGKAHTAPVRAVQKLFAAGGEFQKLVLACVREKMVEMSQAALCNRVHVAEKRLAKWLLMCRDRAPSDEMHITQEFSALMLGSNRVSVTQAAGALQDRGLIKYSRGRMRIVDRAGLEQVSCECYERVRKEFDRITVQ